MMYCSGECKRREIPRDRWRRPVQAAVAPEPTNITVPAARRSLGARARGRQRGHDQLTQRVECYYLAPSGQQTVSWSRVEGRAWVVESGGWSVACMMIAENSPLFCLFVIGMCVCVVCRAAQGRRLDRWWWVSSLRNFLFGTSFSFTQSIRQKANSKKQTAVVIMK